MREKKILDILESKIYIDRYIDRFGKTTFECFDRCSEKQQPIREIPCKSHGKYITKRRME